MQHSRVDLAAQRAQFARAQNELPHACATATVDEVIGPERRELQLRLLNREEVFHRLGNVAVTILDRRVQLAQLVLRLGKRKTAVEVDLQRLGRDVTGR